MSAYTHVLYVPYYPKLFFYFFHCYKRKSHSFKDGVPGTCIHQSSGYQITDKYTLIK